MEYNIEEIEDLRKLINRFKNRCTTQVDMYQTINLYNIFIIDNDDLKYKKYTTYDSMKIENQIVLMLKDLINFYKFEGKNILLKNNDKK